MRPASDPARIINLDPSALIVALYLVTHDGLRVLLMRHMPSAHADCGNQPCWRSALMMWPQLVALPFATSLAFFSDNGGSLTKWCDAAEARPLTTAGRSTLLLFYGAMLVDLYTAWLLHPLLVLSNLMVVHHVVCL